MMLASTHYGHWPVPVLVQFLVASLRCNSPPVNGGANSSGTSLNAKGDGLSLLHCRHIAGANTKLRDPPSVEQCFVIERSRKECSLCLVQNCTKLPTINNENFTNVADSNGVWLTHN